MFDRLSQCLLHLGFYCGKTNSSLFIFHKLKSVYYLFYCLVLLCWWYYSHRQCDNIISDLIRTLSKEFSLKDSRPLNYFLGLEVKYLLDILFVSQAKYTKYLLEHTKIVGPQALPTLDYYSKSAIWQPIINPFYHFWVVV